MIYPHIKNPVIAYPVFTVRYVPLCSPEYACCVFELNRLKTFEKPTTEKSGLLAEQEIPFLKSANILR